MEKIADDDLIWLKLVSLHLIWLKKGKLCEFVFKWWYGDEKYTTNYEPPTFEVTGKI